MKQTLLWVCAALLLVVAVPVWGQAGENLLSNPDLESQFLEQGGEPLRQVAEFWLPWETTPATIQPAYLPASEVNPDRVLSGTDAQAVVSSFAAPTAGIYQVVEAVEPGSEITFTINGYVWSSISDADPNVSIEPGGVTVRVGIDPTGGEDPASTDIVWSEPVEQYDAYNEYSVSATAGENNRVSVWVEAAIAEPVQVTQVFLDSAALAPGGADTVSDADAAATQTAQLTVDPNDPFAEATEIIASATVEAINATLTAEAPVVFQDTGQGIIAQTEAAAETPFSILPSELTATPLVFQDTGQGIIATVAPTEDLAATAAQQAVIDTENTAVAQSTADAAAQNAAVSAETAQALEAAQTAVQATADAVNAANATLQAAAANIDATGTAQSLTLAAPTQTPPPTETPLPSATPTELVIEPTATTPPTATPVEAAGTAEAEAAPETGDETPDTVPLSEEFPGTILYTVQNGDTVAELAALYGSTTEAIIQANGLNENALIYLGQGLIIPVRVPPALTPTPTAPPEATAAPAAENVYIIQPGMAFSVLARRFNTTTATLAQLNGIVNVNQIQAGQRLLLPGAPAPEATPTLPPTLTYTVQPGDNLYRIAVRTGVPLQRLIEVNNLPNINVIYVGQVLNLP